MIFFQKDTVQTKNLQTIIISETDIEQLSKLREGILCLSEDCNIINFNDLNLTQIDNVEDSEDIDETELTNNNNLCTNNEINENHKKDLLVIMCENCFEVFDNKVRIKKLPF